MMITIKIYIVEFKHVIQLLLDYYYDHVRFCSSYSSPHLHCGSFIAILTILIQKNICIRLFIHMAMNAFDAYSTEYVYVLYVWRIHIYRHTCVPAASVYHLNGRFGKFNFRLYLQLFILTVYSTDEHNPDIEYWMPNKWTSDAIIQIMYIIWTTCEMMMLYNVCIVSNVYT